MSIERVSPNGFVNITATVERVSPSGFINMAVASVAATIKRLLMLGAG